MVSKSAQKAEAVTNQILDAFEAGRIPQALAIVALPLSDVPTANWSVMNQMIAALHGHADARGFKQWNKVGRSVKKGEKAFQILGPSKRKIVDEDDDGNERVRYVSTGKFFAINVFGYSQTEGEPLGAHDEAAQKAREFVESLPLLEVAEEWGIEVLPARSRHGGALGSTDARSYIKVGVRNLSTWAHELVHCADAKCVGGLLPGQRVDQEMVAELGGAVLLTLLGFEKDADTGGCWDYIQHYGKGDALSVARELVERTVNAVRLIIETAESLGAIESPAVARALSLLGTDQWASFLELARGKNVSLWGLTRNASAYESAPLLGAESRAMAAEWLHLLVQEVGGYQFPLETILDEITTILVQGAQWWARGNGPLDRLPAIHLHHEGWLTGSAALVNLVAKHWGSAEFHRNELASSLGVHRGHVTRLLRQATSGYIRSLGGDRYRIPPETLRVACLDDPGLAFSAVENMAANGPGGAATKHEYGEAA